VSGPALALGSCFLPAGLLMYVRGPPLTMSWYLGAMITAFGSLFAPLSILPTDTRAIRFATALVVLIFSLLTCHRAYEFLQNVMGLMRRECVEKGRPVPCGLLAYFATTKILMVFAFSLILRQLIQKRGAPPMKLLAYLWQALGRMWLFIGLFAWLPFLVGMLACGLFDIFHAFWFSVQTVLDVGLGLVMRRKDFRVVAQHWLSTLGSVSAAAGLAEIIGDTDAEVVCSRARQTMCGISFERLTRDDMAENIPNPGLSCLSCKVKLGQVDAFVSHSWRDDSGAKWDALATWCANFNDAHGRFPVLWIDKYCIDQNNVQHSLSCLPVYLTGCTQFVVLCGDTYLSRLWCIVELFVFFETVRQMDRMDVLFAAKSPTHLQSIKYAITNFKVKRAKCSTEEDAHRLLPIIEAAHGGVDGFTRWVISIFSSRSQSFPAHTAV